MHANTHRSEEMNLLRCAWKEALKALSRNLLPGLLLQSLMAGMGAAYLWYPPARNAFASLSILRSSWGLLFSFLGTSLASALLPELLRLLLSPSKQGKEERFGLGGRLLFGIPFWGIIGMQVDLFYRLQYFLFGPSETLWIILKKVLFDAFLYCPLLAIPQIVCILLWRDHGFTLGGFRGHTPLRFYALKIFPVLLTNWMVWIPLVSLIYSLPAALGIPFFIVAQSFWVMVLTTLSADLSGK
jgi:hypothetical protein